MNSKVKTALKIGGIVVATLIVVAMVGGYMMLNSVEEYRNKAQVTMIKSQLSMIKTNLELYKLDNETYPESLLDLPYYTPDENVEVEYSTDGNNFRLKAKHGEQAVEVTSE